MDASWMKRDDFVAVETRHPGRMPLAHGAEAADGVAFGLLEQGDAAVNRAFAADGDVAIERYDGVSDVAAVTLDGIESMKEDRLHGSFGGGQVSGALNGVKAGVGGEGEDLGRVGGDNPAGDQFGGDGVIEGVGDNGAAKEGEGVLVFEAD